MKSVISLTLIGVMFAIVMVSSFPEDNQKPVIYECKSMEKASDEDVENVLHELQTQMPLQTPNEKCLLACLYEKSGVIENGHIQSNGLKIAIMQDVEKEAASIDKIIQECASISHPERCEQAAQLKLCLDNIVSLSASN
ncbi:uncharacterized protein LOC116347999 [Contarinia nasturtii]|uniref:uncharacterized protein LOC116347999 n=1 Tax=Contarinia nasturtii TaxID=265458 RepID=UPI0012D3C3CF|nr:uncharacterized protein LOC116347999 [Contarinia nasturtii]